MTTLAAGDPVSAHKFRKAAVKGAAGMVLFTVAAVGLYQGAGALSRHWQEPDPTTYVSQSHLDRTIAGFTHSPATGGGSFIPSASIGTGDVQVDRHMVVVP